MTARCLPLPLGMGLSQEGTTLRLLHKNNS
jgi:hypothetical protein